MSSQLSEHTEIETDLRGTNLTSVSPNLARPATPSGESEPLRFWEIFGIQATRHLQRRMLPHLRWNQEIWGEKIRERLTSNVRWLDAGCGWRLLGRDLEALENELVARARSVVGVDLDLPHLHKHINIAHRICASLDSLPFPDSSFDLVTCNMVLEHLRNPEAMFREVSRVLAPGGRFMIHTPNRRNYLIFVNIVAKKLLPRSLILKLVNDGRSRDDVFPTYYRANSVPKLRDLSKSSHLQPETTRFLTHPRPFSRFFAPAAFFELLLMRAIMRPPLNRFGTTIVAEFRKQLAANPLQSTVA
jgi:ubiquinone/menaquinone biosynthesis C-methylase UbiE